MIGFPLLLIPFAIYNIFVFLMPGVAFTTPVLDVPLLSGAVWAPTFGDALLTLGVLLLLLEVIKASRPGARFLTDHFLSLVVLGAAVAEFVLLPQFATSAFFLLTVLMAVEFLAGIALSVRNRHRRAVVAAPVAVPGDVVNDTAAPAPASRASAEPSFNRVAEDATPVEPLFEQASPSAFEPRPEPQFQAAEPSPEAAPKPAPPADTVNPPAPAARNVANWNLTDLVSDHEPERSGPPRP